MYDELVKHLRFCGKCNDAMECDYCEYNNTTEYVDRDCSDRLMLQAADAIEELSMKLHGDEAAIAGMKREIERMVVADKPRWIPVTERLPDNEDEVVVAFKNSESGEWWYRIDNFVDGAFCYNTAFGRNITHWMPLPEPPKEET